MIVQLMKNISVEVKQRQARKQREDNKETYVPNWFVKRKHPVTGDMFWEYNGKYWPRRKAQDLATRRHILDCFNC